MALTRHFKETIESRAKDDPAFRQALLSEAINELLTGDFDVAKAILKDYINATIKFDPLAAKLHRNSKSIQRMLGPSGNPTTKSLVEVLHVLQKNEGVHFQVTTKH